MPAERVSLSDLLRKMGIGQAEFLRVALAVVTNPDMTRCLSSSSRLVNLRPRPYHTDAASGLTELRNQRFLPGSAGGPPGRS